VSDWPYSPITSDENATIYSDMDTRFFTNYTIQSWLSYSGPATVEVSTTAGYNEYGDTVSEAAGDDQVFQSWSQNTPFPLLDGIPAYNCTGFVETNWLAEGYDVPELSAAQYSAIANGNYVSANYIQTPDGTVQALFPVSLANDTPQVNDIISFPPVAGQDDGHVGWVTSYAPSELVDEDGDTTTSYVSINGNTYALLGTGTFDSAASSTAGIDKGEQFTLVEDPSTKNIFAVQNTWQQGGQAQFLRVNALTYNPSQAKSDLAKYHPQYSGGGQGNNDENQTVVSQIAAFGSEILDDVGYFAAALGTQIGGGLDEAAHALGGLAFDLADDLSSLAPGPIGDLGAGALNAAGDLIDGAGSAADSLLSGAGDAVGALAAGFGNALGALGQGDVGGALGDIGGGIVGAIDDFAGGVGGALDDIGGAIVDAAGDIGSAIGDAVDDIGNAIDNAASAIGTALDDVGTAIEGALGDLFGSQSGTSDQSTNAYGSSYNGNGNYGNGSGYGGSGGYGSFGGGGYYPIVLDLTGKGINITQLSSSNTFFDMKGDGFQHRTAWAGAGNAVLFFDPNNTNQITQADQIVFQADRQRRVTGTGLIDTP